jgi:hypothetical protein
MLYYLVKLVLSAGIIVTVSEVAKRNATLGSLIAALPLTSFLALIWIYVETRSTESLGNLSLGIFWLVLPSLPFFLCFPLLLKKGFGFWSSLGLSTLLLLTCYVIMLKLLSRFGIHI